MRYRTALVTGGAGFIGSALVRLLLSRGWHVLVYDNLTTGRIDLLPLSDGKLRLVVGDIVDFEHLSSSINNFRPQIIFHLAAIHYIPFCNTHPLETLRVNVEGTAALLEACKEVCPDRLVAASTAAVYPILDEPLSEVILPAPTDIYGFSKYFMERLVEQFHHKTGVDCVIARLFNVYGPHETNPHLIPELLQQVVNGASAIKLGNLEPKRDYIYVDDVVTALLGLANVALKQIDNLIRVNIATGKEYSVYEILQEVQRIVDYPIEIIQDPARVRSSDRAHLCGEVSQLCSLLGWVPSIELRTGLRQTLDWMRPTTNIHKSA